ncbi:MULTISPECIES: HPP family protein [Reichenbachiella]|uniref:HPP family protein n=1 Tax=Reichenbachiella agariperforans TaxID=156994 RepID=A0A1M6P9I2_REIAG|nr:MULTISPECIES: HPP family protein [Reichenbachiella]MBU2915382.1 HPP family protein [Reichenbachiella agariperforans]RJE71546.1 HPP family protein [Reichenbachiella sp. MSK19-1]SHK04609.1 HPP family protein [Reichenbachiella agariperforans]
MKKRIHRKIRLVKYILYRETLIDFREYACSFLGSFIGIGLIGLLQHTFLNVNDNLFLIGSFGASSVLIYGAIQSPLSQPRNLVGGHVVSAIVGVTVQLVFPHTPLIAAPLAVSLSIIGMQMTKTLHPPGGATALIAVLGSAQIKAMGYMYVLSPVLSGVLILLLVAIVANNLTPHRQYPTTRAFTRVIVRRK